MQKRGAQADVVFVSARKLRQSLFCLSMANDRKRESLKDSLVIGQNKDGGRRAGLMAELYSRRVFQDVHQLLIKPHKKNIGLNTVGHCFGPADTALLPTVSPPPI